MDAEKQQALDCMVQHINTFFSQSAERKTADYGEPCEKCKYIKECKLDWFSTMHPLLKKSSVKISVVHPERINTQDSDRKDPGLDIKKELQAIRSCLESNNTLSIEKISQKVQEHFQEAASRR